MGRPDEKSSLGRPKYRWEDDIKIDLQVVGWGGMDWIALPQNRERQLTPVNMVMNSCRMDATCYFISLLMCSTCFGH